MPPPAKIRLDKLLVDHGHAASRERAQAMILAGRVLVNEQRVDKPGAAVAVEASLRLLGQDLPFVSRGGLKLEAALSAWELNIAGLFCADIGASTGGFTDCLLQRGAKDVLAVDTGYGQIAHKLRVDPRVRLRERTNARTLASGSLQQDSAWIEFFAMDVSFIGVALVLPAVVSALSTQTQRFGGNAVILVKPQFEAGREHVGKGGIVRDPAAHRLAVDRVAAAVRELGGVVAAVMDSPILGAEGNHEFLLQARFGSGGSATHRAVEEQPQV